MVVRENATTRAHRMDADGESVLAFITSLQIDERRGEVFVWNSARTRRVFLPITNPERLAFLRDLDRLKVRVNEGISRLPVESKDPVVEVRPPIPFGYVACPECETLGIDLVGDPCPRCDGTGLRSAVTDQPVVEDELDW